MKNIICLFCNKKSFKEGTSFYCSDCNAEYHLSATINNYYYVNYFNVVIDNEDNVFIVYYDLANNSCRLRVRSSKYIDLPIDKLLFPLPELKEKINTILAYL